MSCSTGVVPANGPWACVVTQARSVQAQQRDRRSGERLVGHAAPAGQQNRVCHVSKYLTWHTCAASACCSGLRATCRHNSYKASRFTLRICSGSGSSSFLRRGAAAGCGRGTSSSSSLLLSSSLLSAHKREPSRDGVDKGAAWKEGDCMQQAPQRLLLLRSGKQARTQQSSTQQSTQPPAHPQSRSASGPPWGSAQGDHTGRRIVPVCQAPSTSCCAASAPLPSTTLLLSPPPPHLDHDHLGLLLLLGPGLVAALILTVRRRHQARRARLLACSSGSSGRPGVAAVAAATAQPAAAARPLQRRMQINCCTANAISGARKASRRGKERHVPAACRCSAVYRINGTSIPHQWAGDSQSPRLHRAGPDRAPCP